MTELESFDAAMDKLLLKETWRRSRHLWKKRRRRGLRVVGEAEGQKNF
jgi:hypothetical protein